MAKRKVKTILAVVLLLAMVYLYQKYLPGTSPFTGMSTSQEVSQETAKQLTPLTLAEISDKPIEVYFCPHDDCAGHMLQYLNKSTTIHCAFFEFDLEQIIMLMKAKNAQVVVDDESYNSSFTFARKDKAHHLMHNKFCVLDNTTVWTASMNPKHTDNERNNNNVVIISSSALAKNYEDEFEELWGGTFGGGTRTRNTHILLNGTLIENYFCPEDWCANRVLEALDTANKSIYFMTFSFTDNQIGNMLLKKHDAGVVVKGIFEKSQNNSFSEFPKLAAAGIAVEWDKNKYNMHNKVFIIDEHIVVTGSFNPTKNGDTDNDENILIIHDAAIAKKFVEEFNRLY